jgi:hypothetical protein
VKLASTLRLSRIYTKGLVHRIALERKSTYSSCSRHYHSRAATVVPPESCLLLSMVPRCRFRCASLRPSRFRCPSPKGLEHTNGSLILPPTGSKATATSPVAKENEKAEQEIRHLDSQFEDRTLALLQFFPVHVQYPNIRDKDKP